MIDQLPERMRAKIVLTPCPAAGLDPFCWAWTACRNRQGYGKVTHRGKSQLAHRVAYLLLVGQIPEGLELDHLCRRTCCTNPRHLEPVTRKVNAERGCVATKTQCINGHDYTPENTLLDRRPNGTFRRNCRECHLIRQRSYRREKAAS